MLFGDGGLQNTLTAAAGGGRLILQTILGNGRIRGINGDNSCFVAISTTGTSEIDILDIFADLNIIVSQLFIISSPFTSPLQPDCCLCCHHVRKTVYRGLKKTRTGYMLCLPVPICMTLPSPGENFPQPDMGAVCPFSGKGQKP